MFPGEVLGMPMSVLGSMNFPTVNVPNVRNMNPMQHLAGLRAASYLRRMGLPMGGVNRYNSGRMPGMFGMDGGTGVDPNNMDWDQANALLGQFGQHMPTNPSPYAVLPNSGFFGRHTQLGGALEGALFGAANTGPADTWGEGITQVARGILGGTAERARAVNQQFSQPFQQAEMTGRLMQLKQQMELSDAHEKLYQAQAQKDLRVPIPKWTHFATDYNTGKQLGFNPEKQAFEMVPGQESADFVKPTTVKNDYGGLKAPTRVLGILSGFTDENNQPLDPTKRPDPKYINRALQIAEQQMLAERTAGAGVSANAAADRQAIDLLRKDQDEAYREKSKQFMGKPSDLMKRFPDVAPDQLSNYVQQQQDQLDREYQKGKYAQPRTSPLPSRKTGKASTPKSQTITLPNGSQYKIETSN